MNDQELAAEKRTTGGEGRYTRNAPEGKFPFAVAFRLSDGTEPYDLPPPGAR